ncbi:MAG: DUF1549 domain-containing protein [Saprospiraceae bacterium]|nr:DUF1549 domain-containing protein [Saprospiraceae bacterium]
MLQLPSQRILYFGMIVLLMPFFACQSVKPDEVAAFDNKIPEIVDFNFHVKPILSDRCFKCHGPDAQQRKGDLRLDVSEDAFKPSTNLTSSARYIIDPGNLNGSEMALRILSHDLEYMMPTPESNLVLDDREKAILLRWIEQGAAYKLHWSFSPPQLPTIPEVKNQNWAKNNIDHFILKQLESQELNPGIEATGEVVLRRIALDLIGLPPTLEEQSRFLHDDRPLQMDEVIDYFLAQPQYGERMALEWMDVARYADSHGYQDDGMRNTWPYRDWVIQHFNQNTPYDTFYYCSLQATCCLLQHKTNYWRLVSIGITLRRRKAELSMKNTGLSTLQIGRIRLVREFWASR